MRNEGHTTMKVRASVIERPCERRKGFQGEPQEPRREDALGIQNGKRVHVQVQQYVCP